MENNEYLEEDFSDIQREADNLPKDSKLFISHSLDISKYVLDILATSGKSQKDLAIRLKKTEAEISKWLSGSHNLTLRSISKLEDALSISIINPKLNFFLGPEDAVPDIIYPPVNITINYFELNTTDMSLVGVSSERGYQISKTVNSSDN